MNNHLGKYVRQTIIPSEISNLEAAKRLGIDQSSLSALLNGESSLTTDLAVRLENTFGANSKQLLEMQASYVQQEIVLTEKANNIYHFIPSFLTIKARQIEEWADRYLEARSLLPVLLRKLVHSTGNGLIKVDFPGYDNSQRRGSDGFVQANDATPWVPIGDSYWEFGTDKNPLVKAGDDFNARLASIEACIRIQSTYIFVTPRNWPAKIKWETEKNATGEWKNVRVFDANDLEQWLEQSVPAQIWLAEQLNLTTSGYETLNQAWNRWANASDPHLTPSLFAPSIAMYRETFKNWLEKGSNKPFVVTADSHLEALAFLACLFDDKELNNYKDLSAVFTSPDALRVLVSSKVTFIPIVYSDTVERELIDTYNRLHCILYRPRNVVDIVPDVKLDLLSHETFKEALTSMGIEDSDIDRLARESGRSPTILRRRLSKNAAISKPDWARNDDSAKSLVPMALIGAWHFKSNADQKILSSIADQSYEIIENDIAPLLKLEDSPVWSVGDYRGVASKIDAVFAIAHVMTVADLNRFFRAAEFVLSEINPALELPEKDRWAASLYDKKRSHSNALRAGICETLVILSVHGNNLFHSRLGLNVEYHIVTLIRKLLTPLTLEKMLSHSDDLPHYAEAAPEEFMNIIETDLNNSNPVTLSLLKPVDSNLFGASPARTGLLWGLESLAWRPKNLWRVAAILAQLSQVKIEDNWGNKPINSLKAIFRSWMPQTAASVEQRLKVLEIIIKRFPAIGWEICIEQIKSGTKIGGYNYKPNWRGDASGAGQVVTQKERYTFNRNALDNLIAWPTHDEETLGDLVKCLQGLPKKDQNKIWDLIDDWSKNTNEYAKAVLREYIRQYAFTRLSRKRKLSEVTRDRARHSYDLLQPHNPIIRYAWLFADQWILESSDVIVEENYDFSKHEEQISQLRHEAIKEIWNKFGFEGIKQLIIDSNAANVIGQYLTSVVTGVQAQSEFIQQLLSLNGDYQIKAEWCLRGFLLEIKDNLRIELLQLTAEELTTNDRERLLLSAPFERSTWCLLDGNEALRAAYWRNVFPSWAQHTTVDYNEIIDCLLDAQRPRAAFHAIHMNFKYVDTSRLMRLLYTIGSVNVEPVGSYRLNSYHISKALSSLDGRSEVTVDEMARLEFMFFDALSDSEHEIPNLERLISTSPLVYVQALVLCFKRRGEGEDPKEWGVEDSEQRSSLASTAYRLLQRIKRIPGTNEEGEIDVAILKEWIAEVRRLCGVYGRTEVGEECIGQLLSKAPEKDGLWPCKEVCEAMEEYLSPGIQTGFRIGIMNSRGIEWRDEGGKQERELAAKYYDMAERIYFEYPFVGRVLEEVAKSYEHEAKWQDTEEDVLKRIEN
ncbi:helix-turn-helix transcriptional regulator [Paenibacillus lentus]|nr:helix-turn-helix domain-containing protein [Paenibacillus lentus]